MPSCMIVDVDSLLLPGAATTHALAWSAAAAEVLGVDVPVEPDGAVAGMCLAACTDTHLAGRIVGAHVRVGTGALGWAHRLLRELAEAYREVWAAEPAVTCPYPHAANVLRGLRAAGIPLVAVSGRLHIAAARALAASDLAGLFDGIVGGELPDREEVIAAALRAGGTGSQRPVLLTAAGPAVTGDLAAARRLGIRTAAVAPGRRRGDDLPADVILPGMARTHIGQLLALRG